MNRYSQNGSGRFPVVVMDNTEYYDVGFHEAIEIFLKRHYNNNQNAKLMYVDNCIEAVLNKIQWWAGDFKTLGQIALNSKHIERPPVFGYKGRLTPVVERFSKMMPSEWIRNTTFGHKRSLVKSWFEGLSKNQYYQPKGVTVAINSRPPPFDEDAKPQKPPPTHIFIPIYKDDEDDNKKVWGLMHVLATSKTVTIYKINNKKTPWENYKNVYDIGVTHNVFKEWNIDVIGYHQKDKKKDKKNVKDHVDYFYEDHSVYYIILISYSLVMGYPIDYKQWPDAQSLVARIALPRDHTTSPDIPKEFTPFDTASEKTMAFKLGADSMSKFSSSPKKREPRKRSNSEPAPPVVMKPGVTYQVDDKTTTMDHTMDPPISDDDDDEIMFQTSEDSSSSEEESPKTTTTSPASPSRTASSFSSMPKTTPIVPDTPTGRTNWRTSTPATAAAQKKPSLLTTRKLTPIEHILQRDSQSNVPYFIRKGQVKKLNKKKKTSLFNTPNTPALNNKKKTKTPDTTSSSVSSSSTNTTPASSSSASSSATVSPPEEPSTSSTSASTTSPSTEGQSTSSASTTSASSLDSSSLPETPKPSTTAAPEKPPLFPLTPKIEIKKELLDTPTITFRRPDLSNRTVSGDASSFMMHEAFRTFKPKEERTNQFEKEGSWIEELMVPDEFKTLKDYYEDVQDYIDGFDKQFSIQTKFLHEYVASNQQVTISAIEIAQVLMMAFTNRLSVTWTDTNTKVDENESYMKMHLFDAVNAKKNETDETLQYTRAVKVEKIKCLLNYFQKVIKEDTDTSYMFHRRQLTFYMKESQLKKTEEIPNIPIDMRKIKLHPGKKEGIEDFEGLHADFANKHFGGGVFRSGAVQEEIYLMCHPEALFGIFVFDKFEDSLGDKENTDKDYYNNCGEVIGAIKICEHTGYGRSTKHHFKFSKLHLYTRDIELDEKSRAQRTAMVAFDAVNFTQYPESNQYKSKYILRNLFKARAAFKQDKKKASSYANLAPVITGKWGGGHFKGDSLLISLIQLAAATIEQREIHFVLKGDCQLYKDLVHILDLIDCRGLSGSKLITAIKKAGNKESQTANIFKQDLLTYLSDETINIRDDRRLVVRYTAEDKMNNVKKIFDNWALIKQENPMKCPFDHVPSHQSPGTAPGIEEYSENYTKLNKLTQKELKQKFDVHDVGYDGTCLFHTVQTALVDQQYDCPSGYQLRKMCMKLILNADDDIFRELLQYCLVRDEGIMTKDEYVAIMKDDKEWADNNELQMLSWILNIKIILYQFMNVKDSTDIVLHPKRPIEVDEDWEHKTTIYVLNLKEKHYMALLHEGHYNRTKN